MSHQCMVCSYTYEPSVGEPSANVPAGVSFEDLPEDFLCPDCGVDKHGFEPVA